MYWLFIILFIIVRINIEENGVPHLVPEDGLEDADEDEGEEGEGEGEEEEGGDDEDAEAEAEAEAEAAEAGGAHHLLNDPVAALAGGNGMGGGAGGVPAGARLELINEDGRVQVVDVPLNMNWRFPAGQVSD